MTSMLAVPTSDVGLEAVAAVATDVVLAQNSTDDGRKLLELSLRILRNIQTNPWDQKYKVLKVKPGGKLEKTILAHAGGKDLLRAIGFVQKADEYVLSDETNVAVSLATIESLLPQSKAPTPTRQSMCITQGTEIVGEKRQEYEDRMKKVRAERERKQREKDKLKQQFEADKIARANAPAAKASVSCKRAFGSKATTFKDIGVDVNAGGG